MVLFAIFSLHLPDGMGVVAPYPFGHPAVHARQDLAIETGVLCSLRPHKPPWGTLVDPRKTCNRSKAVAEQNKRENDDHHFTEMLHAGSRACMRGYKTVMGPPARRLMHKKMHCNTTASILGSYPTEIN